MLPSVIAQRDLRNRSSEILQRARFGETFLVTTRGERVAILAPLPVGATQSSRRVPAQPAKRKGGWDALPLVDCPLPSQTVLDEMRGE